MGRLGHSKPHAEYTFLAVGNLDNHRNGYARRGEGVRKRGHREIVLRRAIPVRGVAAAQLFLRHRGASARLPSPVQGREKCSRDL